MKWSTVLLVFLSWCVLAPVGNAQDACDIEAAATNAESAADPGELSFLLFDLKQSDCLGGTACTSDVCNDVTSIEELDGDSESDVSEKMTKVAAVLRRLRTDASELDAGEPIVAKLQEMYRRWERLDLEILKGNTDVVEERIVGGTIKEFGTAVWDPSNLVLFSGHNTEIDLGAFLEERCLGGDTSNCRASFLIAADVFSLVKLKSRVLHNLLRTRQAETRAYIDRLGKRWSYYFNNARSLYPWELWANSALYDRFASDTGFANPPNNQLILLHPAPAMIYSPEADDTLEPGLLLELAGWYRWTWDDEGGAQGIPIGGSVILAWDGANNEPGIGGMIHLPRNWSIGATLNSDEDLSVVLSVDLGSLVADPKKLRQGILSAVTRSSSE